MKESQFGFGNVKKGLALLSAAAAFGATLGHPLVSQAFWARQHSSDCNMELGSAGAYRDGCNVTSSGSIVVACPVVDTQANPKTSISTMNVHVEDQAPSFMMAYRCVNYYNATGASCGSSDTSVNGMDTLKPPTFAGWNASDFGAVYVVIPPTASGAKSCLKGMYTFG